MKTQFTLFLSITYFFLLHPIHAQQVTKTLTTSTLSHTFSNDGFIKSFTDESDYFNPTNNAPGYNLGFATGLILTGNDQDGTLFTNVNRYDPSNFYSPGILLGNGEVFEENEMYFNKIWSTSSEEIHLIQELFSNGALTLADLPEDVVEWPAKGNPYFQVSINDDLAPFHDHDNDGMYDPLKGDYPCIDQENSEFIPSKFSFSVYYNISLLTSGNGSEKTIQIGQINYTLDCQENNLKNSVFTRLLVHNKGKVDLFNFKLGFYKDYDLGCYENDYYGSHENSNSLFGYNRDAQDINPCPYPSVVPIPENNSCIYSTVFLTHPMYACMPTYYFNDEVPEPELLDHYDNLMNGKFADGTPLTRGGDGYNPGSNDITKFMFSDLPNIPDGWHLNNQSGTDLFTEGLVASMDLGEFPVGASTEVEFVDVLFSYDKTDLSIFDTYEDQVEEITILWNEAKSSPSDEGCYTFTTCTSECVWPGDVNDNGRVEADDITYLASMLNDNVPNAKNRDRISIDWLGFNSEEWGEEEAGIEYKYGDVNGNGEINTWDIDLLIQNIKLENEFYEKQGDVYPINDPKGLSIEFVDKDQLSAGPGFISKLGYAEIRLGDENQAITASIASLSFDVIIDNRLLYFSPWSVGTGFTFDAWTNYPAEEDGAGPIDYVVNFSDRYSYAFYEEEGELTEGGLLFDKVSIAANELGTTDNANGEEYAKIEIVNILALDKDGNTIDIGTRFVDSILITDLAFNDPLSVSNVDNINVHIFPNPAENLIQVKWDEKAKTKVDILNVQGALIQQQNIDASQVQINSSEWDAGVYFISIANKNGKSVQRVIKI